MEHIEVKRKKVDTPTVASLYFKWDARVLPGQFIMVWVPDLGEVPMSLSKTGKEKCITVKAYGESTGKLAKTEVGELITLRGPYGKPFKKSGGDILLIGGGSGMASLRPLINRRSTGIIASRTPEELLFSEEFNADKRIEVTEDGRKGIKGIVLDGMDMVNPEDFSMIYVCGPERMLKAVYDKIKDKNVNAQFSLERSMKCGIGLCDSCSVNGYQVCVDGPVFDMNQLRDMTEFGTSKLLASGKRVKI